MILVKKQIIMVKWYKLMKILLIGKFKTKRIMMYKKYKLIAIVP